MSINEYTPEQYKRLFVKEQLLHGNLELPTKYYNLVGNDYIEVMERMFQALWHNYKKNKGTISLPYWHDRFGAWKPFNKFLIALSNDGWITSTVVPSRHWGEVSLREEKLLTFVTSTELESIRAYTKFNHYILTNTASTAANKVRVNGKTKVTGLVREGFAKAGNTEFQFDTAMIEDNYEAIQLNLTKSMDKIAEKYPEMYRDSADYGAISIAILDYHLKNPNDVFNRGNSISDSRGRAISDVLQRVFNPISNKDARALLVIPTDYREVTTEKGVEAVYLFIAELLGFKAGTVQDKIDRGIAGYTNLEYHAIDLRNEDERKELHENLWLERVYNELDKYYEAKANNKLHYWSVPIELDASALTTIGAL